jgi:DNA polymerase-3 subunit chi
MTDINFYVSKQEGWNDRLAIAYRLINRAQQHKLAIHIHTDSESNSKSVDDFLWKHEKSSFLPHIIVNSDTQLNHQEITIGHNYEPMKNCDYLINLSSHRPDFFSRYLKLAEIIDSSEEILTAGRKRYAFYRDRGYTLKYHQL